MVLSRNFAAVGFALMLDFRRINSEAHGQSSVHSAHIVPVKRAHFFLQPFFIKRPDLFKQNYRILCEAAAVSVNPDVRGQICFVPLTCDSRRYHCGAEFISDIVLHYEYGSYSTLLGADNGMLMVTASGTAVIID